MNSMFYAYLNEYLVEVGKKSKTQCHYNSRKGAVGMTRKGRA